MHEEQIVRFSPGQTTKYLNSGEMRLVEESIERARRMFGEFFFGKEAIDQMNEKCEIAGVDIQFLVPDLTFAYSNELLDSIKSDANNYICVLRPDHAFIKDRNGQTVITPITLNLLTDAFRVINPFGTLPLFHASVYHYSDSIRRSLNKSIFSKNYTNHKLKNAGFWIQSIAPHPNSFNKTYSDQNQFIKPNQHRRSAIEVVWDLLLTRSTGLENLLYHVSDWTSTEKVPDGVKRHIHVGHFNRNGIQISGVDSNFALHTIGVCPTVDRG